MNLDDLTDSAIDDGRGAAFDSLEERSLRLSWRAFTELLPDAEPEPTDRLIADSVLRRLAFESAGVEQAAAPALLLGLSTKASAVLAFVSAATLLSAFAITQAMLLPKSDEPKPAEPKSAEPSTAIVTPAIVEKGAMVDHPGTVVPAGDLDRSPKVTPVRREPVDLRWDDDFDVEIRELRRRIDGMTKPRHD